MFYGSADCDVFGVKQKERKAYLPFCLFGEFHEALSLTPWILRVAQFFIFFFLLFLFSEPWRVVQLIVKVSSRYRSEERRVGKECQ